MRPTGQPQPNVSTLNSLNGAIVANAAIVPAGTGGAISVFVTDTTDVILDSNGYYSSLVTQNIDGFVNTDGTLSGNGFTVSHPSTGLYTINYTTPFTGNPTIAITLGNITGPRFLSSLVNSAASTSITVKDANGNVIDTQFWFIAIRRF